MACVASARARSIGVYSPNGSAMRASLTRMGTICRLMPAASAADSARHS